MPNQPTSPGTFTGADYSSFGQRTSALPGAKQVGAPDQLKPPPPPAMPAAATPKVPKPAAPMPPPASSQPKPPTPQSFFSNFLGSPQSFSMIAGLFKPLTQAILGYGGMPALMSIYGLLSRNPDWQTASTTAQQQSPVPGPLSVKHSCYRPLLITKKYGAAPTTSPISGIYGGTPTHSAPATTSPISDIYSRTPTPSVPQVKPPAATPAPTPAPVQPETPAEPEPPKIPNTSDVPVKQQIAGEYFADQGVSSLWPYLAKRAPWMGTAIKEAPRGAGLVARLGTEGRNLTYGALPTTFALDALDIAGLNPIGQRQFGSGFMMPAEAQQRADELAGQGAGWRALQGATSPLSTIYEGGVLGFHTGKDIGEASTGGQDVVQKQLARGKEPSLAPDPVTEQERNKWRAFLHPRGIGDVYNIGRHLANHEFNYVLEPERAYDHALAFAGGIDEARRASAWNDWANNRISELNAQGNVNAANSLRERLRQHNSVAPLRETILNITDRNPFKGEWRPQWLPRG